MGLALNGVTKQYGEFTAVDHLTFTVPEGSIFGFLGPNGAGKSTTMRMIMNVLVPDEGSIAWRGEALTDAVRQRFGYLPEERGLYPRMKVLDHLVFLAELKGLSASEGRRRASDWLERLEVTEHAGKRVQQLSKGNQQKIQFIAAVVHQPELVIFDEPFSGLDPINTDLMQQAFVELAAAGTTILFSSHQMNQVESLCNEVALINRSRLVVAGPLLEIKKSARQQVVRLGLNGSYDFLGEFASLRVLRETPEWLEVSVPDQFDSQALLNAAMAAGEVHHFSLGLPSLHDIYVQKVGEANA